jgi:hypothetical protein
MQRSWAGWIIFGLLAITIIMLIKWMAKIGVLLLILCAALYWFWPKRPS